MPDSWLCITGLRRCKWRCEQVLQEDTQIASLSTFPFRAENDQFANSYGERGCISCRVAPRSGSLVMCQPCYDRALRTAPIIIEVPEDHENYKSGGPTTFRSLGSETDQSTVADQFKQSWRHGTTCPEVRAVYKIVNSTASVTKYEQYLCDWLSFISDVPSVYQVG